MQEKCLLPSETVFTRKAFVGTTLSVKDEHDTQCAVLGEHRLCRQKKAPLSQKDEEEQP